eukprot:m.141650 g.141650  ORF g.141650 m.141650 type:complete len:56 (+) comp14041_c0_seq9:943-1110(+)
MSFVLLLFFLAPFLFLFAATSGGFVLIQVTLQVLVTPGSGKRVEVGIIKQHILYR